MIPEDESNLIGKPLSVSRGMWHGKSPPVSLDIANEIPLGKGLGSSAAQANCGGRGLRIELLAFALVSLTDPLQEAATIEGHPDNVAACVLGAVVATSMEPDGPNPCRSRRIAG